MAKGCQPLSGCFQLKMLKKVDNPLLKWNDFKYTHFLSITILFVALHYCIVLH